MVSKQPVWIVGFGGARQRIARVEAGNVQTWNVDYGDQSTSTDMADGFHDALTEAGYGGEPVLIALDSSRCVSASIPLLSTRHGRNRQAMIYQLEPYLPWAAEEVVADYELNGTSAFMVAAEAQPLGEFIERLEQHEVQVNSIVPLTRLALEYDLARNPQKNESYVVAFGSQEKADLWYLENGYPVAWQWLPQDPRSMARSLRQWILSGRVPSHILMVGFSVPVRDMVPHGIEVRDIELDTTETLGTWELAAREAEGILRGQRTVAIELRRDSLAPKDRYLAIRPQLRMLQSALGMFLVCLAAALFIRASRCDSLRIASNERQVEVYRHVFPAQQRIPVGIHARLTSELSRLQGIRGEAGDLPETIEALWILEIVFDSLPKDFRFQIQEIRIENGRLYMVGKVREHGDADRIATQLRSRGLDVEPPDTHRLKPKGVEFRISAKWTSDNNTPE